MKITKQYNDFNPVAIVLESKEDLKTVWAIMDHTALTVENDASYNMAVEISNWLANNVD